MPILLPVIAVLMRQDACRATLPSPIRPAELSSAVQKWIHGWEARGKLPPAVLAVAGRALRTAESQDDLGEVALARVLSEEGRWILLHGASVGDKAIAVAGTRKRWDLEGAALASRKLVTSDNRSTLRPVAP